MNSDSNLDKINMQVEIVRKIILIGVISLVLPVILIPIIKLAGYSEIIEEIIKTLVVLFLILKLPNTKLEITGAILFGFLFGLSENILYLTNIFQGGDFSTFWQRFLWTVPMHIITILIILFSGIAGKKLIIFGLIAAIITHLLFNSIVANIF